MFGLRNKKPEEAPAVGPLDRLGRRNSAETRPDAAAKLLAQGESLAGALTAGYQLGFGIAAACVATGLIIVLVVLRTPRIARAQLRESASNEREAAQAA